MTYVSEYAVGEKELSDILKFPSFRMRGLRRRNGAYRLAEKLTRKSTSKYSFTHAVTGEFGMTMLFIDKSTALLRNYTGTTALITLEATPKDVFGVRAAKTGRTGFITLYGTAADHYNLDYYGYSRVSPSLTKAIAGCQHGMRVYFCTGDEIYYLPIDDAAAGPSADDVPEKRGKFILPDPRLGTVMRMLSLPDSIVFVREHGFSRLAAYGDPMNFRFLAGVNGPSGIAKGSIAAAGGSVYYLCDRGLAVFDGEKITVFPDRAASEIDLSSTVSAAVADGKYFASVVLKNREKWLYCFDFRDGEGHFLAKTATAVFAVDSPACYFGEILYSIGEVSGHDQGPSTEVWLETGKFYPADGEFLLSEIGVKADGAFRLELKSDYKTYTFEGSERIALPVPVRSKSFSLKFSSDAENFALYSFKLSGRTEP